MFSGVHNTPIHLIPWLKKIIGGSRLTTSKNIFTIKSLLQNGPKSTYIDETHANLNSVNLGPLTLWYDVWNMWAEIDIVQGEHGLRLMHRDQRTPHALDSICILE